MSYQFNQFHIPDRMLESLRAYIEERRPVGDFLHAVLTNNLKEAVWRADPENQANLPAFVAYLCWEAPSPCHGSPEKVSAWLDGQLAEQEA